MDEKNEMNPADMEAQRERDMEMIGEAAQRIFEVCEQSGIGCIIAWGAQSIDGESFEPDVVLAGDLGAVNILKTHIDTAVMMGTCSSRFLSLADGLIAMTDGDEEDDDDEGDDGDDIVTAIKAGTGVEVPVPDHMKDGYTPADDPMECVCGEESVPSACFKTINAVKGVTGIVSVLTEFSCPHCGTAIKKYRQIAIESSESSKGGSTTT